MSTQKTNQPTLTILSAFLMLLTFVSYSQESKSDMDLINDFILSQNLSGTISFDASNIKMFWVDISVISMDDKIVVSLNKNKNDSLPFKIQLANVLETQDCTVDVFTDSQNVSFKVLDKDSKVLSTSVSKPDFIQYHVLSSTFHLEDTKDFSFFMQFTSDDQLTSLSIKKIVLSFSPNKKSSFLGSPGFDALLSEIEKNGIELQNPDIKYIHLTDHNKLFVRTTEESLHTHTFFCQIYPVDKADLPPGRESYSYSIGSFSNKVLQYIPKPAFSKSKYLILQVQLPPYKYIKFVVGQANDTNRLWRVELRQDNM